MLIDAFNVWLCVGDESVATIKAIIDGLHSASLILDDIEDGSLLRRGKPATHIVFGQAQAINSANFMFVEAVRAAGMLRNKYAVPLVLEALECLYLGQSWDLHYKHNTVCPTKDAYLTMVDNKTGGLFRMLLQLTVAESGRACEVNFDRLTVLFGRFFQIRDDYMNLCSTSYSEQKGFCEDLDEGKLSYPIVHMLHEDPHATGILDVFRQHAGTAPLSVETKLRILGRLRQSGSLSHTLQYLCKLELECEEEISRLEGCFGEPNPLLRLVLVKLSMREAA
ncbi:Polyprenyl synthetase [Macrophomina phaseolina MS6]|uniref:Polyprenyl synthetase n=1 Tax=Macrophomina phaseolina (strain MS6) TaxID=1126212 RepID=K2RTX6_MACPH|nr:Polyprenyl synthetase [Macrophomina phaseolina MS6]